MLPIVVGYVFENCNVGFAEVLLVVLEGCLNKTTNEYCTEVAIPHVLSSNEYIFCSHHGLK